MPSVNRAPVAHSGGRRLLRRAALALTLLTVGAAATAGGALGALTATTPRLVFSDANGGAASTAKNAVISNPGGTPFTVTGASLSGGSANQFTLPGATSGVVPAGGTLSIPVAFAPSSSGVKATTLNVTTDDPAAPQVAVTLRGLGLPSGATSEGSLQWTLETWQIPLATGDPDPATAQLASGGPIGDEVDVERFRAAGDGTVTMTPLAAFTSPAASGPNALTVGWYTVDDGSGIAPLWSVPNAASRSLDPPTTGPLSFSPGAASFSLSTTWHGLGQRVTYGEDHLNTWDADAADRHKMRVYPMRNADGSSVANAFVIAFEDSNSDPADNQDAVFVLRNVTPVTSGGGPDISIENVDGVPYADRLVMHRLQAFASGIAVHDVGTLRVRNRGNQPLQITELPITGPFQLASPVALPVTIAPFESRDIPVRFTATGPVSTNARHDGTLTIVSDDADEPAVPVELSGLRQYRPEGPSEATLAEIISPFGWSTRIVGPGQKLQQKGRVEAVGDEILSPYWTRLDTTKPVAVRQIAAFHSPGGGTIYWYPQGDPGNTKGIFTHAGEDYQTLLPRKTNALDQPAAGTFVPSGGDGVFGLALASTRQYSDPTLNLTNPDCVASGAQCGHQVRFWPIKDRAGVTVPGTYLATMDFQEGGNFDYQDNVYLISNVQPAGGLPHDETPPAVQSRTPGVGATNVVVGSSISATFSEAVQVSTLTTASFTVARASGGAPVAGTVALSGAGNIATFDPAEPLAPGVTYRATITTAVTDLAGNPMAANATWTFTTQSGGDAVAPAVSSVTPADGATGVAAGSDVVVTFSEPVATATLPGSVTLVPEGGDGPVAGTVTASAGNTVVTLNPAAALAAGTRYTATVSTAVTDTAGNHLAAPRTWTFVTAGDGPATTDPGTPPAPQVPVTPPAVVPPAAAPPAAPAPPAVAALPRYTATGLKAVWNRRTGVLTITLKGRDRRSTVQVGSRYLTPNRKGVLTVPRRRGGTITVRVQPTPLSRGILTGRSWKVTLPAKGAAKVKAL
ncbi:MAG: Ig-like domain-containing protein [Thermoleophilia bacterium]